MSKAKEQMVAKIKQLRQDISMCIILNNALVEEIWQIDEELKHQNDPQKVEQLKLEKSKLNEKVDEAGYMDKIQVLKQSIYELEMQVYGKSEVLWHSPSRHNRFT